MSSSSSFPIWTSIENHCCVLYTYREQIWQNIGCWFFFIINKLTQQIFKYKCVFVNIQNSAYGYYETRQEWDFKYSRYFSGSNISCVATGHQNKTVIKTRQFGVIHCKQLCWYWPLWMYRIKITPYLKAWAEF